jgi:hypothetical protein
MSEDEDKDGLTFTRSLQLREGRLFRHGVEVFASPDAGGVVEYISQELGLWGQARVRVCGSRVLRGRAPVIGVPLLKSLKEILHNRHRLYKSMYKLDNWATYQGQAVLATLVAQTSFADQHTQVELWHLLDVSRETFYMHGLFNHTNEMLVHLDGATMIHSLEQQVEICAHARKLKGLNYQKLFRIDGTILLTHFEAVARAFFPSDDLVTELITGEKGTEA